MKSKTWKRVLASTAAASVVLSAFPVSSISAMAAEVTAIEGQIARAANTFSYSRDFANGLSGFEQVSGSGTLKAGDGSASMEGDGLFIDQNSVSAKNTEVEFTFNPKNTSCNYGVVLRYVSASDYIYVGPSSQSNQHYTSWAIYNQSGKLADISDAGFILDGRDTPYKVKVRVVDKVVTVYIDNEIIYSKEVSGISESAGKVGFRTTSSTGIDVYEFTQRNALSQTEAVTSGDSYSIASTAMTVTMDKNFPRVINYTLKDSGATVTGQEKAIYQVEINNVVYDNAVVTSTSTADGVTYHVSVTDADVSYAFDVVYTVDGNVLEMKIKNIEDENNLIYTINFPEQCMVSMSSTASNGKLRVNNYQAETKSDLSSLSAQNGYSETTLAVLSCDTAAATMSGESYKNRKEVAYKTTDCGDHTSTGLWLNEFTYRGVDGEVEIEEPWAKAAVVGDMNSDGKIDYQDGAVALRDLCKETKTGADVVTSSWNMIAMNVGSEAQYPFLRILDNIKKINLATDGFNQNVIIKGYQSEGHDAAHPDYANYNQRAGGLEDLNTLLQNSEKYNATVGIHINDTDIYPEAPQYANLASSLSAWSWYDTSVGIIRENDDLDTSANGLDGRMAKLFDTDTEGQLDTVYVDVFFGTRWPYYKLVSNINGRNMALGTEYTDEMVSYSVFAHHIGSDFGGAGNLVRFVDNNQADIFTKHQLFRGTDSRNDDQVGIDGWQSAKNLNNALYYFYTRILPNKYLANFPVMQYETDNKAVLGTNNEVVTEMVNGVNVITKDGKKIAEGDKMFIPWDPENETKIYHYNPDGGTTTWELPDSWSNVTSVKLYKLTDEGKTLVDTLAVTDGKVTITADAKQGYVLYKGDVETEIVTAATMEWSTGSPVKDMGFDSHTFTYWKKADSADNVVIEDNSLGNSHLYIKGTKSGEVSQVLTGLTPGESYSASVWVITDENRKASITVDNGGEILENYTTRSNVTYGFHHNDKYGTKAQRMSVRFVAKSDTATLTLSAAEGSSASSSVDFDDVRVMKCGITDAGTHTYYEDFENVDQGLGIFVSEETDQSHLSQKNPLNPEYTTDVISGTYSLKVRAGDHMRTIPSTVRFEANTEYTVKLDYKSSTANAFTLSIKSDKASEAGDDANAVLASAVSTLGSMTKGTLELKFTTGNYDDYYIDITKNSATEYIIDNVTVDAKKNLQQLVDEVNAMNSVDYVSTSWSSIETAKKAAEAFLNGGGDVTSDEAKALAEKLETAISQAERYADSEEKAALQTQIDSLKKLQSSDYVSDIAWMQLQTGLTEAESLVKSNTATANQISAILVRLEDAKNGLTPVVDRTALNAILKKAEAVSSNAVVDGQELQTFLSAISDANTVNEKAGVTAQEVQAAADKLTAAYEAITIQDSSLSTLLTAALEKTDVEEAYFTSDVLEEIASAKAKLEALWGTTGVSVKTLYDILDELDTALAKKQDTEVLTDSLQLDASKFTVTCDNENPLSGSEGPISLAFDGDTSTFWHSNYTPVTALPATIEIDLGAVYTVNQFSYLCRPSGGDNGKISNYDLYYLDPSTNEWKTLVTGGTFANDNTVEKVRFTAVETRKIKFVVNQGAGGFGSAAELAVYKQVADMNGLAQQVAAFEKLDASLYTTDSFAALKTLIEKAKAQIASPETATDEGVASLEQQIQTAQKNLKALPAQSDLGTLKTLIDDASKINTADYKDASAFLAALEAAKKALNEKNSQEEVLSAALALYQAKEALTSTGSGSTGGNGQSQTTQQNLTGASVGAIANKAYTGKALTPAVTVTMNGKTLTAGTDYTVSYKNNTDPGKATVTITGKGSYTGTKTTTFKIVPKKATLKKAVKNQKKAIKVTWKKDAKADGYQISISTSKKFKGKVKNVLVKKNKIVTKVVKNLKSKTTYYVRIRAYKTIDGQKVYGAYSKVKKVKTK